MHHNESPISTGFNCVFYLSFHFCSVMCTLRIVCNCDFSHRRGTTHHSTRQPSVTHVKIKWKQAPTKDRKDSSLCNKVQKSQTQFPPNSEVSMKRKSFPHNVECDAICVAAFRPRICNVKPNPQNAECGQMCVFRCKTSSTILEFVP